MISLTPPQRGLLNMLKAYIAEHGQAPTQLEIMGALGIKHPSNVHRLLVALEERGRIWRKFNTPRAILIVPEPYPYPLPSIVFRDAQGNDIRVERLRFVNLHDLRPMRQAVGRLAA